MGCTWKWVWPKSVGKLLSNVGILMTLYLCVSLLTFSGVFGSAARVFNRAADLADVGGAAVVRVSEAAVDAVHHGLSLGADLWSGIELQNVQLRKQRGQ
jgi:hypothetical protein